MRFAEDALPAGQIRVRDIIYAPAAGCAADIDAHVVTLLFEFFAVWPLGSLTAFSDSYYDGFYTDCLFQTCGTFQQITQNPILLKKYAGNTASNGFPAKNRGVINPSGNFPEPRLIIFAIGNFHFPALGRNGKQAARSGTACAEPSPLRDG